MSILVTGANGMVGSYITWADTIKTDIDTLDVTNKHHLEIYRLLPLTCIIHLAAETDLEFCEREPQRAFAVNTFGTYNVLQLAMEKDIPFVYISTAGVFDGKKNTEYNESDTANPINVYGASKWCGDMIVKTYPKHYIFRSGWMMGGGRKKDHKFVAKIIKKLESGEKTLYGIGDIVGNPTYAKDLISKISQAIGLKIPYGLYNCCNASAASRFDEAQAIVDFLGYKVNVIPTSTESFATTDKNHGCLRSHNEMLNIDKAISHGLDMRHWKEALAEYLVTEWVK